MVKRYIPDQIKQGFFKRSFWRIADKLSIASIIRLLQNKNSYLVDQGWFLSVKKGKSVDSKGQALPWLTYPLINFIEPRLKKSFIMFEYGCGNSTIWFAKYVKEIHSVEHDKEWYREIDKTKPANAHIYLQEIDNPDSYSAITFMSKDDAIPYSLEVTASGQLYDIILIDGVYRNNSVVNSIKSLKNTGVIIVDNIDYVESRDATEYLRKAGFKKIEFWGMCPIAYHDSCTAIFYREGNCLDI